MSGFFFNYAVIVTVPLVGKLKVTRNDCRIYWIVFNNRWMAKLVSWCPGMRPSLFGGLDSGLDCGTGLWDWTQRKLR